MLEVNKFIVNVSAMEGKFYRFWQTPNIRIQIWQAAINMMTRTSSEDYSKSNIFMIQLILVGSMMKTLSRKLERFLKKIIFKRRLMKSMS